MRTRKSKKSKVENSTSIKGYLLIGLTVFFLAFAGVSSARSAGIDVWTATMTALTNAAAMVKSQVAEAAKTMAHQAKSIGAFTMNTVTNVTTSANTMLGNLKIATAQNAQSAQALAEVQTQASQKAATARQTIHMQNKLIEATRKYGVSGQGYNACTVVASNQGLDFAQDHTKVIAAAKETQTLGAIMPKADLFANNNHKLHIADTEFCAAGNPACSPSSLPGGHVNAGLIFAPSNEGSKEQVARHLFRENLLSVNTQAPIGAAAAHSPAGQTVFFKSNRQAALLSPAAYSLAYIDAQNTRTIDRDGKQYSANELIENTVGRYYGGAEAKDWQASMITQEPRGLLVEAARLSGLSTWLTNHMYQQSLRKEANLASILIASASPLAEDVRNMGNRAEATAARSSLTIYR